MADPDPSLILSPMGDLPSRQDFKDLLMRRIAAVRVQKGSSTSTPLREASPEMFKSMDSVTNEKELLADMATKAQSLAKSLQAQLENEKQDKEQKIKLLQRKHEFEIAALREEQRERHSFADKHTKDLRDTLLADMKEKETKAMENEEKLKVEIQRLQAEAASARHQLTIAQRELSTERLLKPQSLDQQLLIKQLQLQVASLTSRIEPIHKPVTPVRPESALKAENPKSDIDQEAEQKIAELTAQKLRADQTIELMLKFSSEKEAELTEEAERLRLLNNSFMEFTNKSEEWVKTGFESLAQKLDTLSTAFGGVSPALESAVASCSLVVQETKARLLQFMESELTGRSLKQEVLQALDQLKQYSEGMVEYFTPPVPHIEFPNDLLKTCSQLQKEMSTVKQSQLLDHEELSEELRMVTDSAAQREAELLQRLEDRTLEVKSLREQLSDLLDMRLQDELRMSKSIISRLQSDLGASKRYILVLASCVKSLQDIICELSTSPSSEAGRALRLEIQRLSQENDLLVGRMRTDAETYIMQVSTLQEEANHFRNEIRQLRSKLDQYHQIQVQKTMQDWNIWKDQYSIVSLANEQLRRSALDTLQQTLYRQTERGEIDALKKIITLKNEEVASARTAAATGHQEVLRVLQELKDLLQLPAHTSDKVTELDKALQTLTEAATSLLGFQHSQTQRLQDNCASLTGEIQAFHNKLNEIAEFSRHLLSSLGGKPESYDTTEKEYFAQSLEALKSMHEAEIDSFRQEVTQMEDQYSSERRRCYDCAKKLFDSIQFRQTIVQDLQQLHNVEPQHLHSRIRSIHEDTLRHQQWEMSLVENLMQMLGPDQVSNAIEEVNESSEVSEPDTSKTGEFGD